MEKIYDFHIHQAGNDIAPNLLIEQMEAAGVYGGSIFSVPPASFGKTTQVGSGNSLEERLEGILNYTKDYPERLFPVLWVHPDEPDVEKGVREAAKSGIVGFKVICNNFFVYEDKSMRMLEAIAETGLPVAFHTGILWDKSVSGLFGKPLNWEKLLEIPNIRFSVAHCSWPWIDECIGLYSKFLSLANNPDFTPEIFLDLTPGTPISYRDELLQKIVNSGFDVFHNMLYGTDCNTGSYASAWAKKWIDTDSAIFDKYGVSKEDQRRVFHDNFLRFWHLSDEQYRYKPVKSDGT
ncbi:MAG: amidohydrolase family protein [Oscillospiraceae bacterium]|nr:amidohydrolase family protein [Oscillospiraceae bacterium]